MLYYAVLDTIIVYMFLDFFNVTEENIVIPLPENFCNKSTEEKKSMAWWCMYKTCRKRLFENSLDSCSSVREGLEDSSNPEHYWVSSKVNGRYKCHFCDKSYAFVTSLKVHEKNKHDQVESSRYRQKHDSSDHDKVQDYILMLFKLVLLHKNLNNAVDMGDG